VETAPQARPNIYLRGKRRLKTAYASQPIVAAGTRSNVNNVKNI
jgi:hypothetical protein